MYVSYVWWAGTPKGTFWDSWIILVHEINGTRVCGIIFVFLNTVLGSKEKNNCPKLAKKSEEFSLVQILIN